MDLSHDFSCISFYSFLGWTQHSHPFLLSNLSEKDEVLPKQIFVLCSMDLTDSILIICGRLRDPRRQSLNMCVLCNLSSMSPAHLFCIPLFHCIYLTPWLECLWSVGRVCLFIKDYILKVISIVRVFRQKGLHKWTLELISFFSYLEGDSDFLALLWFSGKCRGIALSTWAYMLPFLETVPLISKTWICRTT